MVDTGVLTQPRTQQYGTCTSYVSQENGLNLRFNHRRGHFGAGSGGGGLGAQTAQNFQASLESEDAVSFSAGYDSYEVNGRVVGGAGHRQPVLFPRRRAPERAGHL